MTYHNSSFHPSYRIISIEYADTGHCNVGVQIDHEYEPIDFRLSVFCYRWSWLKNFHYPDLETIWHLTRQQPHIPLHKRCLAHAIIKFLAVRDMLHSWDDEAKHSYSAIGRDDDW